MRCGAAETKSRSRTRAAARTAVARRATLRTRPRTKRRHSTARTSHWCAASRAACALHVRYCVCAACALHVHCMCAACALHVHCMHTASCSRCRTPSLWQSLENQQLRDVHQLGARSGVLIRGAPHVPRMRSTSCVSCALHVHCICTAHLRRDLAAISLRSRMYTCTACIVCAPHAHRMHHCQAPLLHSTLALALALALTLSP